MQQTENISKATALFEEAAQLQKTARYKESVSLFEKALPLYEKADQWPEYVRTLLAIGNSFHYLYQMEEARQLYQTALEHAIEKLGEVHAMTAQCYNNLGVIANRLDQLPLGMKYYKKALDIRKKLWDKPHRDLALTYHNLGTIHARKGDYLRSLEFSQKALDLQLELFGEEHLDVALSYFNFAFNYSRKGDNDKAQQYYQKSLAIRLDKLGLQHPQVALCYMNIGAIYGEKKEYQKQVDYTLKAVELYTAIFGEEHPQVALCYNNLGHAYGNLKQFDKELFYNKKSLEIRLSTVGINNTEVARSYHNLSAVYGRNKEYDKQLEYSQKSLEIYVNTLGLFHPDVSEAYNHIAFYHFFTGNTSECLRFHQKSLQCLVRDFKDNDFYSNPPLVNDAKQEAGRFYYSNKLINVLFFKGRAFLALYEKTGAKKDLQKAFQTATLAASLIDKLRQSYHAEGSKLNLAREANPIYEIAIRSAIRLYSTTGEENYLQQAFTYLEKSKAIILFSLLKEAAAKSTANIPAELLDEEYHYRIELNYLEQQIQRIHSEGELTGQNHMAELQSQYFDYSQQYEELINRFETDYPEYYRLKYDINTVNETQVADLLEEGTVLIEYFVGEKSIFLAEIWANKQPGSYQLFHIHEFKKPVDFDEVIEEFTESIEDLSRKSFIRNGHQLYQWLLEPVLSKHSNLNRLIIVPDAQLHHLPFEALLTEKPDLQATDYNALPYVLHKFAVSYHYSATLFCHAVAEVPHAVADDSFVGFAPVYSNTDNTQTTEEQVARFSNGGYRELVYSEKEVEKVRELFDNKKVKSQTFLHEQAGKEQFRAYSQGHKYVHIAAHGILNRKQPEMSGIVFSPIAKKEQDEYILYIGEAFHLDLNAELMVLSCCESGLGKLQAGEGIMAINRGLMYSGARNIIYTLFKVYDQASSALVHRLFYEILENNLTYPAALRQAKLDLIRQEGVTPKSWAGFVLLGR